MQQVCGGYHCHCQKNEYEKAWMNIQIEGYRGESVPSNQEEDGEE